MNADAPTQVRSEVQISSRFVWRVVKVYVRRQSRARGDDVQVNLDENTGLMPPGRAARSQCQESGQKLRITANTRGPLA